MPSHRTPRGAARNASAKIAAASGSDRCYDDEMAPPNTSRPTARHAHTTATSKYNARAHQTKRKHPHQIKGTRVSSARAHRASETERDREPSPLTAPNPSTLSSSLSLELTRRHTLAHPQPAPRHVGDRLLIEQEGCLFPCETLEVVDAAQGVCLIHYLGWDDIRDEEVGRKGCAARVLPDTPEHRVLRADLEAQIRRIQRKGNQLPRVRSPVRCRLLCGLPGQDCRRRLLPLLLPPLDARCSLLAARCKTCRPVAAACTHAQTSEFLDRLQHVAGGYEADY